MIHKCNCVSKTQDELHGYGNRVMNPCKPSSVAKVFRCTVCLKEHSNSSSKAKKSGKKNG